jgi:hypothetical protein
LPQQCKTSSHHGHLRAVQVRRGYQTRPDYYKREPGVLAIKIQGYFEFRPDWYRGTGVADLVKEYYWVIRRAKRTHSQLRRCLTRCRHCRIFFLTHPRNAGRQDLGCPFGCREAHRKRESTKRSVAYYSGEAGRKCRRIQNGNRQFTGMLPVPEPPLEPQPEAPSGICGSHASHGPWPTPLLVYLRMVISLIEERPVSREEILEMLARVLRQRSIPRRRKMDHIIERLNEHPP